MPPNSPRPAQQVPPASVGADAAPENTLAAAAPAQSIVYERDLVRDATHHGRGHRRARRMHKGDNATMPKNARLPPRLQRDAFMSEADVMQVMDAARAHFQHMQKRQGGKSIVIEAPRPHHARLPLPFELFSQIILMASGCLSSFSRLTSTTHALREFLYRTEVKAQLLLSLHGPKDVLFAIGGWIRLPDSVEILECLLAKKQTRVVDAAGCDKDVPVTVGVVAVQCWGREPFNSTALLDAHDRLCEMNPCMTSKHSYSCCFLRDLLQRDRDDDAGVHARSLQALAILLDSGAAPTAHQKGELFIGSLLDDNKSESFHPAAIDTILTRRPDLLASLTFLSRSEILLWCCRHPEGVQPPWALLDAVLTPMPDGGSLDLIEAIFESIELDRPALVRRLCLSAGPLHFPLPLSDLLNHAVRCSSKRAYACLQDELGAVPDADTFATAIEFRDLALIRRLVAMPDRPRPSTYAVEKLLEGAGGFGIDLEYMLTADPAAPGTFDPPRVNDVTFVAACNHASDSRLAQLIRTCHSRGWPVVTDEALSTVIHRNRFIAVGSLLRRLWPAEGSGVAVSVRTLTEAMCSREGPKVFRDVIRRFPLQEGWETQANDSEDLIEYAVTGRMVWAVRELMNKGVPLTARAVKCSQAFWEDLGMVGILLYHGAGLVVAGNKDKLAALATYFVETLAEDFEATESAAAARTRVTAARYTRRTPGSVYASGRARVMSRTPGLEEAAAKKLAAAAALVDRCFRAGLRLWKAVGVALSARPPTIVEVVLAPEIDEEGEELDPKVVKEERWPEVDALVKALVAGRSRDKGPARERRRIEIAKALLAGVAGECELKAKLQAEGLC